MVDDLNEQEFCDIDDDGFIKGQATVAATNIYLPYVPHKEHS